MGAGVSGLVAAYELGRAGHDVVVLEASERVGGRVRTLRAPFVEDHWAEAGAARIRPDHDLTLGYAEHLGLALDRFYPRHGHFVEWIDGVSTERTSAAFRGERPDYVKIRGGTDRLPLEFAARLQGTLFTGSPVALVERSGGLVSAETENGTRYVGDRVLVSVPLTVLTRIEFRPPLSAGKMEAGNGGFGYQPATRIFVQFAHRFWEPQGRNGWGVSDWPEELWQPTWDAATTTSVLLTYVRGDRARTLDAMTDAQRRATLLTHWGRFLPGVSAAAGRHHTHSWQEQEWIRAGWASPTVTEDGALSGEIARREGEIHFCGEHASRARGWMQGALESGLRAAREIHEA